MSFIDKYHLLSFFNWQKNRSDNPISFLNLIRNNQSFFNLMQLSG